MIIRRSKRKQNFSVIDNEIINNNTLSGLARAILIYILSKPDDWNVKKTDIKKNFLKDSLNAISKSLKELRDAGYAELKALSKNGKLTGQEYIFTDSPVLVQSSENGRSLSSEIVEPRGSLDITNTDLLLVNTKEIVPPGTDSPKVKKFGGKELSELMSAEEFSEYCKRAKLKHVRMIGWIAKESQQEYDTAGEWQEFFARNLRAASRCCKFSDKKIKTAVEEILQDDFYRTWAVETVYKKLTAVKKKSAQPSYYQKF